MLLYSIWVARNKTVHREGLCDREGTVAIRTQFYFYVYIKFWAQGFIGDKSEGIKSRGVAEAFIRVFIPS